MFSNKVKMWIVVFGIMCNLGLAFHQYVMFIRAYAAPEKAIILFIDKFHEANAELVVLTVAFMIGLLATYYVLKNIKNIINVT